MAEGAHDLELAGGFAGEVEDAFAAAGAELGEREFKEGAGFAEAGGGFEEDDGMFRECGGEVGLGSFLPGAEFGEGRAETEIAEAFAGAEAEVEEFADAFELSAEKDVVARGERDGLREAAGDFDEVEFCVDMSLWERRRRCGFGGSVT